MKCIQKEQFANYIKLYERLIFTICLSFTKNYFDAEDLAQETFLSASKNIERFDGENVKAWLTTIAANKCRDYLKSPARNTKCIPGDDFEFLEDGRGTPEEILLENDRDEKVQRLCQRLEEPYQAVAKNYFCENLKLSEVARDTGQSLKTLQTRLYRAKKLLRELWKEEFV